MNKLWWDEQIQTLSNKLDSCPSNGTKSCFITACIQYTNLFGEYELWNTHKIVLFNNEYSFKDIVVYKYIFY